MNRLKTRKLKRRDFLRAFGLCATAFSFSDSWTFGRMDNNSDGKPNLVYVFADQWRAQSAAYAGDKVVHTPNLDKFSEESFNFTNAVSCCPVCCPYRASLVTGQYPLTHGVFLNDVLLRTEAVSIAEVYKAEGYDTAYIGKWHLNGPDRRGYIPVENRQGFDYWKVLDCTHNYNHSLYYAQDNRDQLVWKGYDAIAQTLDAQKYIQNHAAKKRPFVLFLSWGPPHNPYQTAPKKYRDMYKPAEIKLRPNIPNHLRAASQRDIAGYYAHITALDECFGNLRRTINETGIDNKTIFVFTSDHGDMLGSQGCHSKQKPWDESIRVPFLLRYPKVQKAKKQVIDVLINTPDIMPTLLGLSGIPIPLTVEGKDYSGLLRGVEKPGDDAALIMCPSPFGEWTRKRGGREFRGIRTRRYTFVRDLRGPWLLYDNKKDPFQLHNLANQPAFAELQAKLNGILQDKLRERKDDFLPGPTYIGLWNIKVGASGTVRYK